MGGDQLPDTHLPWVVDGFVWLDVRAFVRLGEGSHCFRGCNSLLLWGKWVRACLMG